MLGAATMSWDQIADALRGRNRRAVLTVLATVDAVLENDGGLAPDTQNELTAVLLPERLREVAALKLREPRTVAFANQPVWILEKLALLHADELGDAHITEADMRQIGHLLLAVADHLDDAAPVDLGDPGWQLLQHLLRMESLHARENAGAALQRVWMMLVDLANDSTVRATNRVGLDSLLRKHDGVDVKTYLAAGSAFVVHYGQLSLRARKKPMLTFLPRQYFSATKIAPEVWDRLCAMVGLPAADYAARLREEHTRTGTIAFGFRAMREFPLVRHGDAVSPISLRFLRERVTTGLLWRLRDHGLADRVNVAAFLGELFEEYIYRKLAEAHAEGTPTPFVSRVHRAVPYRLGGDAFQSTDVVIDYGDRLVMIEVALSSPRLEDTQIRAGRGEFERDVDRIVVQNARQLDRNLKALLAGAHQISGVDPTRVRRVYPVIVTLGSMPDGDLLWAEYEEALNRAHVLQSSEIGRDIARLQLLSAEEVELLRYLIPQGPSLADLLSRKDRDATRNMAFKNFLFRTEAEGLRRAIDAGDGDLDRVRKAIVEIVVPKDGTSSTAGVSAGELPSA